MQLTERQNTILVWLRKSYPKAANLFVSALRLRVDEEMPCRVRLIAHALRELCTVIINQHSGNSRVDIDGPLKSMASELRQQNYTSPPLSASATEATPGSEATSVSVSVKFMQRVTHVVEAQESKVSHKERSRRAFQSMSGTTSQNYHSVIPTADRWHDMYDHFVARAHDHDSDEGDGKLTGLDQEIQFLEETLESLAQSAISNLDDLDGILENANS